MLSTCCGTIGELCLARSCAGMRMRLDVGEPCRTSKHDGRKVTKVSGAVSMIESVGLSDHGRCKKFAMMICGIKCKVD